MIACSVIAICMFSLLCSCSNADKSQTLIFASWYTEESTLAYRDIAAKYHELYPEVNIQFITLEKLNKLRVSPPS